MLLIGLVLSLFVLSSNIALKLVSTLQANERKTAFNQGFITCYKCISFPKKSLKSGMRWSNSAHYTSRMPMNVGSREKGDTIRSNCKPAVASLT